MFFSFISNILVVSYIRKLAYSRLNETIAFLHILNEMHKLSYLEFI